MPEHETNMPEHETILRRVVRSTAVRAVRYLAEIVNSVAVGGRLGVIVRRLGFFSAPEPAEIIANYLRGLVLFGRPSTNGAWFHWYWIPARAVITQKTANVPKRLRSSLHRGELEVRFDQDFEEIMHRCQQGRAGWLTHELVSLYMEMLSLGLVSTVGTYREGLLVGGLWGLGFGRTFAIMSMFHTENNAGAFALASLVSSVSRGGRWAIIDCGSQNTNWERYGAKEIPVQEFSALVTASLLGDTGGWTSRTAAQDLLL